VEKKSTSSRDTRLAGRIRFYKQVGVAPVSAPWEKKKNDETTSTPSVDSPISAGVDGSPSASGVHHLKSKSSKNDDDDDALQWMLSPRRPGLLKDTNDKTTDCSWFGITLDGRSLSTPMGQTLAVPSERLAYAIAAEWDAQAKYLQPANMPFMTLACTTLDQAAHHPDFYREQALNFLPTDTVRSYVT
jgi:ATP synthase F1 complex assembly factor 2